MKKLLIASALALFVSTGARSQDDKKPQESKNAVVVMETSMGTIEIELNAEKAPITVKNFLAYVDKKFYDGTIFHRVIKGFMIQGGGFDKDMKKKDTDKPIKIESDNGLKNERGTIAMARTSDPDSATSQFYINHVDNSSKLDRTEKSAGYAVFGKVTSGMDVVDKIAELKTTTRSPYQNVPEETVTIKTIKLKGKK